MNNFGLDRAITLGFCEIKSTGWILELKIDLKI